MRIVFDCTMCGYRYKAMWYEPNWLARKAYVQDHKRFHNYFLAFGFSNEWAKVGVDRERYRITKILETTGAEFLTKPELQELLDLIGKDA